MSEGDHPKNFKEVQEELAESKRKKVSDMRLQELRDKIKQAKKDGRM